jgi:hypothetical protein
MSAWTCHSHQQTEGAGDATVPEMPIGDHQASFADVDPLMFAHGIRRALQSHHSCCGSLQPPIRRLCDSCRLCLRSINSYFGAAAWGDYLIARDFRQALTLEFDVVPVPVRLFAITAHS